MLSPLRRAVQTHKMIQDGDRVAVGLSGGKDSLVLLTALKAYQRFSPQKFELCAVTIDMGLNQDLTKVIRYCKKLKVPYHIEPSNIAPVVFELRKEKNPCSLCSKMRRGLLNSTLNRLGCNKLALAHHADDLMETFFLSLLHEGRLNTFAPMSYMSRAGITVIRPLVLASENEITLYAKAARLPILHNPCPVNRLTQREYMKNLIKKLDAELAGSKTNIFGALTNPQRSNLWQPPQ